ncbi:MAG: TetR/AcrR family transcriptional regulator [Saprospiraceae bacterium]|nr:TetR/AcrR family transcriptional regulator [Bacteroidia bacterium]NNE15901.1 TetR/AcrR family transcriptional regulator [Saprospiraceae bacterium]NNL92033.1 TetR/AcrR family transcriptional regulator [Saprospiraceae bacterium]
MARAISITVCPDTYHRNPLDTELGRNIIRHSIDLLSEKGFQCFNFKMLASSMKSTEASVYRYFENKQMLLVYLTSWYWEYLDYLIMIHTTNIEDPKKRLRIAIKTIVDGASHESQLDYINLKKLHKIIVEQSSKVIKSKKIENCKKQNLFSNFENLNDNLAKMIISCDSNFKYPSTLATNMLKMAIDHTYYAEHLCSVTEITNCMVTKKTQLEEMLVYFVERLLRIE